MSIFSSAINGFRSTASRAGKFYNSPGARRARRIATGIAYQGVTGSGAASIIGGSAVVGAVGGAATGGDHRMRGAMRGAALGAAGGFGYRAATSPMGMRMASRATRKGVSALYGLADKIQG